MSFWAVVGLATYNMVLLLASLTAVVQIWPESQNLSGENSSVRILWAKPALQAERHLLLIVLFAGLAGASLSSVWGLAYELQQQKLANNEFLGYLIIFFGLFRGGLISGPNASKEINVYGMAGVAGLVGLSSIDIVYKLVGFLLK
jgi:hypothetical protein